MKLLGGGNGFLGGYVLREAGRRGHQTVALARSPMAARAVAGNGAQPIVCGPDDGRRLDEAFADACCEALVCPAPLGPGPGISELVSRHPRLGSEQLLRPGEGQAFPIDDAIRDLGHAPRPFAEGTAEEVRELGLAA